MSEPTKYVKVKLALLEGYLQSLRDSQSADLKAGQSGPISFVLDGSVLAANEILSHATPCHTVEEVVEKVREATATVLLQTPEGTTPELAYDAGYQKCLTAVLDKAREMEGEG